jgi:hypothetical protein
MNREGYDHQAVDNAALRVESDRLLTLYRIRRSTGWIAFFTFLIAIGAAAGGYFLWQQLQDVQDQLDQLQELADKVQQGLAGGNAGLIANTKAVQALAEKLSRNIDTPNPQASFGEDVNPPSNAAAMELSRPWLATESISVGPLQPNSNWSIKATIRNSGRSPALGAEAIFYTTTVIPRDISIPDVKECSSCARMVLPPNASTSYDLVVDADTLTKEKVTKIRSGDQAILLLGRIDYLDAANAHHTTMVCMAYAPSLATFNACTQGNRLD